VKLPMSSFTFKSTTLNLTHPKIMGILNITPDSFSDGGQFSNANTALKHARLLEKQGADIIDIGAESTRPGHTPLNVEDEIARLLPTLKSLIQTTNLPISVDTYKSKTAESALEAGAHIINDIWGLTHDDDMAHVVASYNAGVVIMHNRHFKDDNIDILNDMINFFSQSLERAKTAGIPETNIILDPGIGFGKTQTQNLQALKSVSALKAHFNLPILVGASRKSFINLIHESPVSERLAGTLAAHLYTVQQGASVLRVHDVASHVQALAVDRVLRDS
jgi:dihydropteroate synthase